ncbi:unnamed protein product [Arctogadus glacialis]
MLITILSANLYIKSSSGDHDNVFQPLRLMTSPLSLSILSHFQKDMNDIVAGVQQYQSSLLDNLRRQMKDVNSVIRKQFSCVDAEEIPIAPTIIRKKRGGSRECLIKDKHELAGFKEGVGFSYSKCRHCECSFEDMQSQFNEDAYTKRTLEKHVRQCDEIEKANTDLLRNSLRTTSAIPNCSKYTNVK